MPVYYTAGGSAPILVIPVTSVLASALSSQAFPSEAHLTGEGRNRFQNHPRVTTVAGFLFASLSLE
jgi:hypothetical protein